MIEELNNNIFYSINIYAGRNTAIDHFARITAEYLPLVFVLWLLVLWFKKENINKNIALFAGYSTVVGISLNFLITAFYFHPRPFMVGIGTLLVPHAPETSFPSDHTTFMLSIAIMLIYFKNSRTQGITFLVLSLIGGISRVFCGLHFPLDIIGSIIIALLSSFLIYCIRENLNPLNSFIISIFQKNSFSCKIASYKKIKKS
jgi:undecaprenyl-diphosphatase